MRRRFCDMCGATLPNENYPKGGKLTPALVGVASISVDGYRIDPDGDDISGGRPVFRSFREEGWSFCTDKGCFDQVVAAIQSLNLASIPVATSAEVESLRRAG